MHYAIQNFISPNFGPAKLDSPSFEDLVDVFEDRMRNWFLMPAEKLLHEPHCQIAAVALLMSYFEGISIYLSGKDSKNNSFEFFADGFSRVFPIEHAGVNASTIVAKAVYNQARCGFAHDGIFRNRVFFSEVPSEPLILSFPIENGALDFSRVESIIINPFRFCESIRNHFEEYLKCLRDGSDRTKRQAFAAAVVLKWALDEPDRAIGMNEEEFFQT